MVTSVEYEESNFFEGPDIITLNISSYETERIKQRH